MPAARAAAARVRQADHRRGRHHAARRQRRQRLHRDRGARPPDRRHRRFVAAGEGNPDRPVALPTTASASGASSARRAANISGRAAPATKATRPATTSPAGSPTAAADWNSRGARWMSAACHRSLYGYQLRTALALAIENPQAAVTFLPLACTGATIENGLFGSQGASDCPADAALRRHRCRRSSRNCRTSLTRRASRSRAAGSTSCCSRSAPTTSSSPASSPTSSSAPASNARCSARAASSPPCSRRRRCLTASCRATSPSCAPLLKPLVGGNLSRVVYVSYGHPAMAERRALPRRPRRPRHASGLHRRRARLKNVTEFRADEIPAAAESARALRGRRALRRRRRPHDLRRRASARIRRTRHLRAFSARIRSSTANAFRPTATASTPIRSRRRPRRWSARCGRASSGPTLRARAGSAPPTTATSPR